MRITILLEEGTFLSALPAILLGMTCFGIIMFLLFALISKATGISIRSKGSILGGKGQIMTDPNSLDELGKDIRKVFDKKFKVGERVKNESGNIPYSKLMEKAPVPLQIQESLFVQDFHFNHTKSIIERFNSKVETPIRSYSNQEVPKIREQSFQEDDIPHGAKLFFLAKESTKILEGYKRLDEAGRLEATLFYSAIIFKFYNENSPEGFENMTSVYCASLFADAKLVFKENTSDDSITRFLESRLNFYAQEIQVLKLGSIDDPIKIPGKVYHAFYISPLCFEPEQNYDFGEIMKFTHALKNSLKSIIECMQHFNLHIKIEPPSSQISRINEKKNEDPFSKVFVNISQDQRYSICCLLIFIGGSDEEAGNPQLELKFINKIRNHLEVASNDSLSFMEKHGEKIFDIMITNLKNLSDIQKELLLFTCGELIVCDGKPNDSELKMLLLVFERLGFTEDRIFSSLNKSLNLIKRFLS